MQTTDKITQKKPTNVSINRDLLAQAKALNINLSSTLEQALNDKIIQLQTEKWKKENKSAIQNYNHLIEEQGIFGDDLRMF